MFRVTAYAASHPAQRKEVAVPAEVSNFAGLLEVLARSLGVQYAASSLLLLDASTDQGLSEVQLYFPQLHNLCPCCWYSIVSACARF